jgi:hypothetical protein
MENQEKSLFERIFNGKVCVLTYPSRQLISEDLTTIEEILNGLGVQITPKYNNSERNIAEFTIGDYFVGEFDDMLETALILPGMDTLPLYIVLSKIGNIFLNKISDDKKITSIIWRGGGSVNIDGKYYTALKKYWLKKRKLRCIANLTEKRDLMLKELSEVEGFSKIYDEYIGFKKQKEMLVEAQDFEKAAYARDNERMLLPDLDVFVSNYVESLWKKYLTDDLSHT